MGNGHGRNLGQKGGTAVVLLLLGCWLFQVTSWAQSSNAPVITAEPTSQFVLPATDVMFSVTATNPYWMELSTNSWGSFGAATNAISDGLNSGRLMIHYDFYAIPDTMHVYYDGFLLFDSGLMSGAGTLVFDYGPGLSTNVIIVINEGDNPDPNTAWDYTATASIPLAYQWLKGNVQIPLATNDTYWITNVQIADAAAYSVVITNVAGATNSSIAYLSVAPAPKLAVEPAGSSKINLSWPTNCPGFFLQKNVAIDDAGNWVKVPDPPTIVAGHYQITLLTADESQFFRLSFDP